MFRKQSLQRDIDRCSSIQEAVHYLRAKEKYPRLTLKAFRKKYRDIDLTELTGFMVGAVLMMGIINEMRKYLDGLEVRGTDNS